MSTPFSRAPHQGSPAAPVQSGAPNAALLIDFDNVTMGMRSDLSKDLQKLLSSEVIRGKVTVQRAYADWRRYPQYIVPLSENSIDLIFAPAYGSSKKNATDIRMAIDGMELVFTRPEIGTYILLTGDSDFSSLVLKLKEYGKYVIGVGIQESSSDILVQNCDEYYSYTSLAGLTKTTETDQKPTDPWVLVEKAVARMQERDDVMRSDRLKQVMIELDPAFDEGSFGFSKFSRFVTEASSRGLIKLKRMENGQYEVSPGSKSGGGAGGGRSSNGGRGRRSRDDDRGGRSRGRGRGGRDRDDRDRDDARADDGDRGDRGDRAAPATAAAADEGDPLQAAYELMRGALRRMAQDGRDAVRDSDVKRKMLEADRSFDEAELGFSKFSRFLRQADEHGVVILRQRDTGNYEVSLPAPGRGGRPDAGDEGSDARDAREREERDRGAASGRGDRDRGRSGDKGGDARRSDRSTPPEPRGAEASGSGPRDEVPTPGPSEKVEEAAAEAGSHGLRLGPRRGSTRRRRDEDDGPPPLLPGQAAGAVGSDDDDGGFGSGGGTPAGGAGAAGSPAGAASGGLVGSAAAADVDAGELGLPRDAEAQIRYLTNSYRGVGKRTAEALVEGFGEDLFEVLQNEPERVQDVLPSNRADQVLEAWRADFERRRSEGH